jgi:adenylate kinase
MNVVFLGPPGSGKGTQAKRLASDNNLTHLSTGDVFRDNIANQTPLGLEIKSYVDSGKLVPDELVSRVVFDKIGRLPGGVLLDGYPRTLDQAKALEDWLRKSNRTLDAVLFFDVDFAELTKRLSARRSCGKCKEVYNLANKPPKKEGVCDLCGSALVHRPDDQPAVIQERLHIYSVQTEPILDFYRKQPVFRRINGAQEIGKVYADLDQALKELSAKTQKA